CQQHYTYPLTF
nr:immunoglobulin light chain junction region [Macaca mulatta]MOV62478.1 immunoglobulin light chain junction region [Macaca mulatta]MOV62555.1 immunoglobulin light chain junction region [Macaca mulatta]MOV64178.1 immunoglobulin light chain junction region [Macaca mulatta]MOV65209.1 immunoglobulin light chain junction region [Macaca mulatta]